MLAYFGNLPAGLTTPTLQSLLSLCGSFTSFKRPADSFALIEFAEDAAARRAKALFSGLQVEGKEIGVKVEEAKGAEEGEIEEELDELTFSGKRREIERMLQQKRLAFEWTRTGSKRSRADSTDSGKGTKSTSTSAPKARSRPAVDEEALKDSLKRMERDFKEICQRDAERAVRHARDVSSLQAELATMSATAVVPVGDLEKEFDASACLFDANLFVKEKDIFGSILKAREEKLSQLPCLYNELLQFRQLPANEYAQLLVAREACKRLQLPAKVAQLALNCLNDFSNDPLELLCSDPAFLMAAKGAVEGECLLSCILRTRAILE